MKTNNIAAFGTVTTLAAGTAASVVAAATAIATVATVAYSTLAITLGAISIASVTAWVDKDSKDAASYFKNVGNHAGYAVAGMYQFAAQIMVQALIQGVAQGVGKAISRKIGGPDHTVEYRSKF